MRKVVIVLLVILLSFSAFASTIDEIKKDLLTSKYNIVISGVEVSANHASSLLKSPAGYENPINLIMVMVRNLTSGNDSIANANLGLGFSIKNFGFAFDASVNCDTYCDGRPSIESLNVIPTVLGSASLAYARHIYDDSLLSIDASVVGHVNVLVQNDKVSYQSISELMEEGGEDMGFIKGYAGIAVLFDLQANVKFSNGINCYVAFNNLFGKYHLTRYEDVDGIVNGINFGKDADKQTPWHVNIGASYDFDFNWCDICLFTNLNSINNWFKPKFSSGLKKNFDIGAKFDLYNILDVELGIFGGYLGASASVGLNNNRIKVSYGWNETGELYGQSPVDYLKISAQLGWKK